MIACLLLAGGVAAADPETLVRAELPNGPMAAAPGTGVTIDGGWGGAHAQALGAMSAEALLAGKITVRAGFQYDVGTMRPSAGAGYTLLDPFRHAVGLLIAAAYKPEGLTEPEGELETTLALSRRVGDGLASASVTYGQDFDGAHHDGELALALVEPVAKNIAFGGMGRGRSGLGSTTELGANWDGLAGAVGRVQVDQYTVTALGGTEVLGAVGGGTRYGALVALALGAWW